MLDAPIRRMVASPLERWADAIAHAGIRANVLTFTGFMMGLTAAVLIADSQFVLALLFLALNRFLDVLDGMVARQTGPTGLGAFLDTTLDLFVYAAVPFGFALARQQDALAAAFLLMGLMVATIPGLTMRAIAARSGAVGGAPLHGHALLGHSETFIAFALMCIAPRWMFTVLAYVYGVLCIVSGALHVSSAVSDFRGRVKS